LSALRTPSQTIGPFFAVAIPRSGEEFVIPKGTPGGIWLRGRVTDGAGDPVPDAMIETWQAGPDGRFADEPDSPFHGFGRSATDADGWYAIFTLKPGRVTDPEGARQAPHVDVVVFARGLTRHLVTRVYFEDEAEANATDPVLASVPDPEARATLVAERSEDGYVFDIRLQGEGETAFFEI
jgi:protocatechuate 3,4-dioxygenase alpha subunit